MTGAAPNISPETSGCNVFLSYAHVDRARARRVHATLQKAGFTVWWDERLEVGAAFGRSTEQALETADAVVVLWSERSVRSNWVLDEASSGRDTGRLVPVSLDGTQPPLGFRQFQSIDLSRWKGSPTSPEIRNVFDAIAQLGNCRAPAAATQPSPSAEKARKPLPRLQWLVPAGVLLGGLATVAYLERPIAGSAPAGSIAILPFENLSRDPNQAYFSDGLSQELRTALAGTNRLRVTAQTSSNRFRDEAAEPTAVSKALGVRYLLEGSVRRLGNTVRVSAQLIDGRTGFDSWSETYQRDLSDIFAVQSDIARRVASALEVKLGNGQGVATGGGTTNAAAYDAYLRGAALYDLALDETSDKAALAQFKAAVSADPNYALAWAALSRAQTRMANAYASDQPLARQYDEAIASARKAVALAPQLARGYAALGYALLNGRLDARAAAEPYRKAYQYGRGDADLLQGYATFMARIGHFDDSKGAIGEALSRDPFNPTAYRTQGRILFAAGDFDGSRRAMAKALELSPGMSGVHDTLGQIAFLRHDYAQAKAEFAKETNGLSRLQGLAMTLPRLGDKAGGDKAYAKMMADYGANALYQQAEVLAQRGDKPAALGMLERAYASGDSGLVLLLSDPLLAPLAGEPRFRALLRKIGLSGG